MVGAGHLVRLSLVVLPLLLAAGHVVVADARPVRSTVAVPGVVGLKWQTAERRLRALGLRVRLSAVQADKPGGVVVAQRPVARSVVVQGTIVRLRVSGPAEVAVPDVVGSERATAE